MDPVLAYALLKKCNYTIGYENMDEDCIDEMDSQVSDIIAASVFVTLIIITMIVCGVFFCLCIFAKAEEEEPHKSLSPKNKHICSNCKEFVCKEDFSKTYASLRPPQYSDSGSNFEADVRHY
uniref:Uncharacterized protein n=1 Tax=Ditylenchus dipsaci TaxID=166011 RepID=A0A915CZ34_9BILA